MAEHPQQSGKQLAPSAAGEKGSKGSSLSDHQKKMLDILVDMAIKDLLDQGGKCETGVKETTT